jgi:hypothetical protein
VFGVAYELIRSSPVLLGENPTEFRRSFGNFTAAAVACVFSAPLNFVRVRQYATHPKHVAPTTVQALTILSHEALQHRLEREKALPGTRQPGTLATRARAALHVVSYLQQRLRIGWGTARVAFGMATGQWVFGQSLVLVQRLSSSAS